MSLTSEAYRTRLVPPWRGLARLAWLLLVGLLLSLYATDTWRQIAAGLAGPYLTWQILMPLGFTFIAGAIFLRKSDDWLGLLTSFALVGLGAFLLTGVSSDMLLVPGWRLTTSFLQGMTAGSFVLLAFVFPDGHFAPTWARSVGLAVIGFPLFVVLIALLGWPELAVITLFLPWALLGLALQVYRYIRVSGPVQRQQSKWVVAGLLGPMLVILLYFVALNSAGTVAQVRAFLLPYVIVQTFVALALPLALAFSILRYRLWDIDVLVNRALVYGTLTLLLGLGYFGLVVVLQALFQAVAGQARSELVTVLSTLLIAVIAAPLRRGLQGAIDRRFYRHRYDAARTLASFGATLRDNVDLDQLSNRLLAVVDDTMQPVDVSLWIKQPRD